MFLFINTVPSIPRNLTVQVVSNTTISFNWLPPENENGIIIEYGVRMKEQGLNKKMKNFFGEETFFTFNSLKPYTKYIFRVRARTSAGWGNFSEEETAQTKEGRMYIILSVSLSPYK